MDHEIAQEIWALRNGEKSPTGNKFAREAAEAILPPLEYAKKRLNEAGARIGDALDYVTHTVHDPRKMRLAAGFRKTPEEAFEAW